MKIAIEQILAYAELQSLQDENGWIRVEDLLPEAGEDVLIFTYGQEKEQVVGRINKSGKWLMELGCNYDEPTPGLTDWPVPQASTFEVVNVTYWMPLPSPPTKEQ